MKIRNASTDLHEIKIIEPEVFEDNRGFSKSLIKSVMGRVFRRYFICSR